MLTIEEFQTPSGRKESSTDSIEKTPNLCFKPHRGVKNLSGVEGVSHSFAEFQTPSGRKESGGMVFVEIDDC